MSTIKKIILASSKAVLWLIGLLFVLLLIVTTPFWWRRWVAYPQLEKARTELWAQRQPTRNLSGKEEYKGVLHAHSYWSHDSRGVLSEILPAAQKAKLDFIFFSDHPHGKLDSFPRSYAGFYEGIILECGTEASSGLMVNPMKEGVVNWNEGDEMVISKVVAAGGFVGFVHTEKEHAWDNPHYQAMEIYNIHTDLLDEERSFLPQMILNAVINGGQYRHWTYRELFDVQEDILKRWDALNRKRRVVGFGAVDAHNNQGFRARYMGDGLVEWVGPNAKTIKITAPGWKEKLLLGKPDTAGWAFKWEVDTYFDSFNFVNTHVFCDTFSKTDIMRNLVKGHAFVAFESLADASGFQFYAQNSDAVTAGILGDSLVATAVDKLMAVSPFPVKFALIKDGQKIDETTGDYSYTFDPRQEKGVYRLEASLLLKEEWTPWVYTNPIYLY